MVRPGTEPQLVDVIRWDNQVIRTLRSVLGGGLGLSRWHHHVFSVSVSLGYLVTWSAIRLGSSLISRWDNPLVYHTPDPLSPDWTHSPHQAEPRGRGRGLRRSGGSGLCVPGPGPDLRHWQDTGSREEWVRPDNSDIVVAFDKLFSKPFKIDNYWMIILSSNPNWKSQILDTGCPVISLSAHVHQADFKL